MYDMRLEYNYKKMPREVKEYLIKHLGRGETKKLTDAIRAHKWIILTGPKNSGKSAILEILYQLGYPFVVDENGLGVVIRTSERIDDPKPIDDILEELGIDSKY